MSELFHNGSHDERSGCTFIRMSTPLYCRWWTLWFSVLFAATAVASDPVLPWTNWRQRFYQDTIVTHKIPPLKLAENLDAPAGLGLPLDLPGDNEFVCAIDGVAKYATLRLTMVAMVDLPATMKLDVFVKDWDDQWLQIRHSMPTMPIGESWSVSVPLFGEEATKRWQPKGHRRPWHRLFAARVREVGVKFSAEPSIEFKGAVILTEATLVPKVESQRAVALAHPHILPREPTRGQLVEVGFDVAGNYPDPFDTSNVDIRATVVAPDDSSRVVRAFYFEDFLFDAGNDQSRLVPFSHPEYRVRYTPKVAGRHVVRISGHVNGEPVSLPDIPFDVADAAGWRGFVVRAEDPRFLKFSETGEEFCGIGVNVRSPYDLRYEESYPFTRWRRQNLAMYRELFATYAENGINVVEVWMSPWWLALEWMPDAPGNHGIGHMNQWRAWKLDQLLAWAEEFDIYLVLLINNHGKFSKWCDSDWGRNPYNKARGGPFDSPQTFFTDEWAKGAFKRTLDYIVARWSHSPHLLTWKLFSEIDLTGDKAGWYKDPAVRRWHQEMGQYVKSIDGNRHLITTHWCDNYNKVNSDLALLPELDILTLDAYYHGSGAQRLYDMIRGTVTFADTMGKPCIITEFGGSPWGDSMAHMLHQLHLGLWTGFIGGLAAVPCFWWFPLIEEKDLYHEYRAISRFAEGEQRSGAVASQRDLSDGLKLNALRGEKQAWYWVFDSAYYFSGRIDVTANTHQGVQFELADFELGSYDVEFWNCREGTIIEQRTIEAQPEENGSVSMTIELPSFSRDIAVKLRAQR